MACYTVTVPSCGWVNVDADGPVPAAAKGLIALLGIDASDVIPTACTVTRHNETWVVHVSVVIDATCVSYQNSEDTTP